MKSTLTAAALLMMMTAGLAVAGEGNGEPFAHPTPGITHAVGGPAARSVPAPRPPQYAQLLPSNDSMGIVQSANSLPTRIR